GSSGYATTGNGTVLTLRNISKNLNHALLRYTATIGNNAPIYSNEIALTVDPAHSLGVSAIALDRRGVIYTANRVRNTIEYIDLDGAQHILAGDSLDAAGWRDGSARAARFNAPRGLALGGGTLFVADTGNNVIRGIDLATNAVATLAGSATATGTGAELAADGPAAAARLNKPAGLALDSTGLLFIADSANHTVRTLDLGTGEVSTIAGEPGAASPGETRFNTPLGLALSEDESVLYVADSGNHAIRAVTPSSAPGGGFVITTLAGSLATLGALDGTGTDARFNAPGGVAVADGVLYVADTNNSLLRAITGNTVATLGGSGGSGFRDGVPAAARFNKPEGIAADARRDLLFIADTGNQAVRVLDIETAETTTPALTRATEPHEIPATVDKGGPGGGGAPSATGFALLLAVCAVRFLIPGKNE
ncbi:MAG: hypothetical protein LBM92_08915, partial [Opitutaceae bacterium]|nr:hypothetical protein [Opitutaceae bacterium]